jgi:hypothetical protein
MPDTQDLRFSFDHTTAIITIADPILSITIQEVFDAIAYHRARPLFIDDSEIARAEGKVPIPGIGNSLIILTMLDGWRVKFADRPGPTWEQAEITAGVIVVDGGGNPIAPANFVNVSISQAVSGVSIQQPKIDEIHQMLGLLAGSPMIESSVGRSSVAGISGDNISQTFTPNFPSAGQIQLERDP